VGGSWLVAFLLAIAIYRNGLHTAGRIKLAFGPIATMLEKKYYFDEVYGFVFVKGCIVFAHVSRFFDTYIIDMFANLSARITERFSVFSGRGVDANVVDGVVNGIAVTSMDVSNLFRSPQTGRIRNYVLFAAGGATVVVLLLLFFQSAPGAMVVLSSLNE
jgi:NADH-quinone oxidoreductase subunit L